jgi:hypothetical protein
MLMNERVPVLPLEQTPRMKSFHKGGRTPASTELDQDYAVNKL